MCALAHEHYMKTLQALIQGVSSLIKHLIRSNRRRGRCRAIASLLVRGTNSRIRKGEDDAELVFRSFSPSLCQSLSMALCLPPCLRLSPSVFVCLRVSLLLSLHVYLSLSYRAAQIKQVSLREHGKRDGQHTGAPG